MQREERYKNEIFDEIAELGIDGFNDPELDELHSRARRLHSQGTLLEGRGRTEEARQLYRQADRALRNLHFVEDSKDKGYDIQLPDKFRNI